MIPSIELYFFNIYLKNFSYLDLISLNPVQFVYILISFVYIIILYVYILFNNLDSTLQFQ